MRFTTCRIMHVKFVNGRESVSAQCLRSVHAGEVHGAKNNERHVCGRPRVVSGPCLVSAQCPVSRQCLVSAQCLETVCGRHRDGEAAVLLVLQLSCEYEPRDTSDEPLRPVTSCEMVAGTLVLSTAMLAIIRKLSADEVLLRDGYCFLECAYLQ